MSSKTFTDCIMIVYGVEKTGKSDAELATVIKEIESNIKNIW